MQASHKPSQFTGKLGETPTTAVPSAARESAAVGIPDPQRGESVKLFAVLNPEYKGQVSEQALIDWARDNMAAYKYPRAIAFRDQLPATGAGKVLRRLLKDE